ncbi:hypothetical protein D3C76_1167250 [compost metagenome]
MPLRNLLARHDIADRRGRRVLVRDLAQVIHDRIQVAGFAEGDLEVAFDEPFAPHDVIPRLRGVTVDGLHFLRQLEGEAGDIIHPDVTEVQLHVCGGEVFLREQLIFCCLPGVYLPLCNLVCCHADRLLMRLDPSLLYGASIEGNGSRRPAPSSRRS